MQLYAVPVQRKVVCISIPIIETHIFGIPKNMSLRVRDRVQRQLFVCCVGMCTLELPTSRNQQSQQITGQYTVIHKILLLLLIYSNRTKTACLQHHLRRRRRHRRRRRPLSWTLLVQNRSRGWLVWCRLAGRNSSRKKRRERKQKKGFIDKRTATSPRDRRRRILSHNTKVWTNHGLDRRTHVGPRQIMGPDTKTCHTKHALQVLVRTRCSVDAKPTSDYCTVSPLQTPSSSCRNRAREAFVSQ